MSKETRVFDGREYVMETALHADYAFVRARRADRMGNLQYHRTQRNFGPVMARAARTTIVEADEPVVEEGDIDPDHIHTPGLFVDRIVVVPPDGIQEEPPDVDERNPHARLGFTPTPASSAGQALTFPHPGGRNQAAYGTCALTAHACTDAATLDSSLSLE